MAKVILDTNFVLHCVENKVDFYEEISDMGHQVVIPREVKAEIERIKNSTKSLKVRERALLASKIIDSEPHEEISCPGRYVDTGIKNYLKDKPEILLATLDKDLKRAVRGRKLVIRNKKKLEVQ